MACEPSLSPIKFASSLSRSSHSSPPESSRGLYDDEDESDEQLDLIQTTSLPDIRKYRNKQQEYYKHAVASSISSSPTFYAGDTKQPFSSKAESNLAGQYRLLSFLMGQLLEDDFTLSRYKPSTLRVVGDAPCDYIVRSCWSMSGRSSKRKCRY